MEGRAAKTAVMPEDGAATRSTPAAMAASSFSGIQPAEDTDAFRDDLINALTLAYPELLQRIKRSYFTDWHRKHGAEVELAHNAVAAVMESVLSRREMPDNILAYLVTAAKRLAQKDWEARAEDPLARTASDPTVAPRLGDEGEPEDAGTQDHEDQEAEPPDVGAETPLSVFSSMKGLPPDPKLIGAVQSAESAAIQVAITKLPARQREVFLLQVEKGNWYTQREMAEQLGISEHH